MFSCRINARKPGLTVDVSGALDENAEAALAQTEPKLQRAHVVFDLSGVQSVNSLGYRQWTKFLQRVSAQSTFDLANCPQAMLEYAALLPALSYAAMIRSVLVPYQCESCSRGSQVSYEVDAFEGDDDFPVAVCSSCAGVSRASLPFEESLGMLRAAQGSP